MKRRVSLTIALLIVTMVAVGCGGNDGPTAGSLEAGTVTTPVPSTSSTTTAPATSNNT